MTECHVVNIGRDSRLQPASVHAVIIEGEARVSFVVRDAVTSVTEARFSLAQLDALAATLRALADKLRPRSDMTSTSSSVELSSEAPAESENVAPWRRQR